MRSVVAADDAEHRPLGEVRPDESSDLRRPDALGSGTPDLLAELVTGALYGGLGTAIRLPGAIEVLSHVSHAVMMPRPDG